jgi:flagellar basal body rod protein FlgG
MVLEGRLTYQDDGMTVSTRAMVTQIERYKIHTDNVANFGVPGYQGKKEVVTSFVEYLGPDAVDKVTNSEIGRLRLSANPLDFALNSQGYFQRVNASGGIELTRDGRFKLDKDGYLLSLDNKKILSSAGAPLRFPYIPKDFSRQVKVDNAGEITLIDLKGGKSVSAGKFGIANMDGSPASTADVKQNYVEDSNVMLQDEYVAIMPLRRQFEANRQLFIMQSDALSRMIQELGRTQ